MSTYEDLRSYQNAVIVCDFTVEFVNRYVDGDGSNRSDRSYTSHTTYQAHTAHRSYKTYSRQADQMLQAARSGKQNITEGSSNSKQKPKEEIFLLGISSASLKELLEDYKDYLRQHELRQWAKDDPRAVAIRKLAYKSYETYESYMSDPESAANAMICLISQTTYLIDQQIKAIEKQLTEKGITLETHTQKATRILNANRRREKEMDEMIRNELKKYPERYKEIFGKYPDEP